MSGASVIDFWFEELKPEQWWVKDPLLDRKIAARFSQLHRQAASGELFSWRDHPEGRLAEIIILDQFSRNMFRDTPQAFAFDPIAIVLAQEAIARGADKNLLKEKQAFFYLPFTHSESEILHEEALRLFKAADLAENLEFELRHKAIIERFGRYPHRNAILGRISTPEEIDFLKQPGSAF